MTHDEKVARLVKAIADRLGTRGSSKKRLATVLGDCGWKKKSPQNLARIQEAIDDAGLHCFPRLSRRLPPDTWIAFSATPFSLGPLFANEEDLRDFLVTNFLLIDAFRDLRTPQPEFRLPSGHVVDILCRDRNDGAWVVVELKKAKGDVVGQITRYLTEVKTLAGASPVKALVITGVQEPELARNHSTIAGCPVDWRTYRVDFQLEAPA